jgi:hypothetical protein
MTILQVSENRLQLGAGGVTASFAAIDQTLLSLKSIPDQSDSGQNSHYLVQIRDGEKTKLLLVEPFTWMWIAAAIASGIISGTASKVFTNAVFGTNDLNVLEERFVKDVQKVVRIAIAAEAKRRLDASVSSLGTLLVIYQNSRDASLINPLLIRASDCVTDAVSLGMLSFATFMVVGGLALAVLQEKYYLDRSPGNLENVKFYADRLIDYYWGLHDQIVAYERGRVSELQERMQYGRPWYAMFLDGEDYSCTKEGIIRYFSPASLMPDMRTVTRDEAENIRQGVIRAFLDEAAVLLDPSYSIAMLWRKISQGEFPQ